MTGLQAALEVRTCSQLAEQAGHAQSDALQRLLYRCGVGRGCPAGYAVWGSFALPSGYDGGGCFGGNV
ncbi:hypothetical protein GCM10009779_16560 [Polymorphospora rubra]